MYTIYFLYAVLSSRKQVNIINSHGRVMTMKHVALIDWSYCLYVKSKNKLNNMDDEYENDDISQIPEWEDLEFGVRDFYRK